MPSFARAPRCKTRLWQDRKEPCANTLNMPMQLAIWAIVRLRLFLCLDLRLPMPLVKLSRVSFLNGCGHEIQPQIEPTSLKTLLHFTV